MCTHFRWVFKVIQIYISGRPVIFKHFQNLQIMVLKCLKSLDFSWKWDTSASSNTNYFKEDYGHQRSSTWVCFLYVKASHMGKDKLPLTRLLTVIVHTISEGHKKGNSWNFPRKGKTVLQNCLLLKKKKRPDVLGLWNIGACLNVKCKLWVKGGAPVIRWHFTLLKALMMLKTI